MKENRSLWEDIIWNAKNNRIFMSWLIFDFSTLVNKAFVALYLEEAIRLKSIWMFLVACYYGSIAIMRTRWQKISKKVYTLKDAKMRREMSMDGVREVGALLLGLNIVFGGFVTMVMKGDGSFKYGKYVFYVMALYILFGFWASVTNAIRDRKLSILWNALRMINLSAAVTGLFILTAGLYDNYMINDDARNLMVSMTGSLCFIVLLFITLHTLLLVGEGE